MKALPPEAIKIIVDSLQASSSPLFNVLFLGLGGVVKNVAPTATAYYYRGSEFLAVYSNQWLKAEQDQKLISEIDTLRNKLLPYTEGDYLGNPDRNLKDPLKTYYGGNVQRLIEIKAKYDPDGLFYYEQGIPVKK